MNRRALLSFVLCFFGLGCAQLPSGNHNLNGGWRFVRRDVANAQSSSLDDRNWQHVNLPHTWNNLDGQDGGNDYYRGVGWYRRHVSIPASDRGKRFFIRFEATATVADVFVNGTQVGTHRGNFAAFCFDITNQVHIGDDNILAVRVDNSKFHDVPPLSGDFTIFGGLYRDVSLLVREPLCISPIDDASPGVYLTATRIDDKSADVTVTTKLLNAGNAADADLKITVAKDATAVTSSTVRQRVDAHATAQAIAIVTIPRPHLWDGVNDPYLYHVIIELLRNGKSVDRVTQPLGLRRFNVDPQLGLILNGRRYPLHGVNRHQDRPNKGWAISHADHEEDFRLIREMGCTGVRLAHYQHAVYFYSLCDQGGLVAWAELPMVNDIGHSGEFAENAKQQLRELIKQNYNHPSIFFWSLYNELALRGPNFGDEQRLVTELRDLAHKLDPTRPTTAATHKMQIDHPVNWIPDLIAFNRYYGWYTGRVNDWPGALDKLHEAFPNRCIGISEYGAGASIFQHEQPTTKPKTGGSWHPEEWQSVVHEAAWDAMKDRPWLWCTFIWNMFDFAADQRHEGDHAGRNDKGLVTYDRKTKKDAFFFYKANWTDEPVIHINDSRFTSRPVGPTQIKIYSNCDDVTLFIDGNRLAPRRSQGDCVFIWRDVMLDPGGHKIQAVGHKAGRTHMDTCNWTASQSATTRMSD
jgi:beta-galactosidase